MHAAQNGNTCVTSCEQLNSKGGSRTDILRGGWRLLGFEKGKIIQIYITLSSYKLLLPVMVL